MSPASLVAPQPLTSCVDRNDKGSFYMTTLLSAFRSIGAVGNNLQDPALDPIPGTPEPAIAAPNFAPGTADDLVDGPNPRTISKAVTGATNDATASADSADPTYSAWLYTFGQFVDHDLDLESVGSTDISIPVPADDPVFPAGTTIPITRAITDPT